MLTMALLTMTRLVRRRLLGRLRAAHHHAVRVQMDVRLAIASIAASVSVAMVSIALLAVVRESPKAPSQG